MADTTVAFRAASQAIDAFVSYLYAPFPVLRRNFED
jgi:hypothetical protein